MRKESQSLSGWDGVFHESYLIIQCMSRDRSQSLSGWDGVFHVIQCLYRDRGAYGRNPFQGGMGFFTLEVKGGVDAGC